MKILLTYLSLFITISNFAQDSTDVIIKVWSSPGYNYHEITFHEQTPIDTLSKKIMYGKGNNNGAIIKIDNIDVYLSVDSLPKFKGDLEIFLDTYTSCRQLQEIYPLIYIECVIDQNGQIIFPGIAVRRLELVHPLKYYDEALEVVKLMPNWIPATRNGKKVASFIHFPVRFALD